MERTIDVYLDRNGQMVEVNAPEAVQMRRTVIDADTGEVLRTESYQKPREIVVARDDLG